jgi:beta-glucosidase
MRSSSKTVLIAALMAAASPAITTHAQTAPAADTQQAPQSRADALVKAMTLDEKLQLIHGYFPPLAKPVPPISMIPSAGHIPGIPRLGIPTLRESDASLGVANQVEQRCPQALRRPRPSIPVSPMKAAR